MALGTGPAAIPRHRLTASALAVALGAAADREMQERARELGVRIRAEDGVGGAVVNYTALAAALP